MPIQVVCAKCGHVAHFADNDAGLAVSCLSCRKTLRVPTPSKTVIVTPESSLTPTLPPLFAQQPQPVAKPASPPLIVKPAIESPVSKPPISAARRPDEPAPGAPPSAGRGKASRSPLLLRVAGSVLIAVVICGGMYLLTLRLATRATFPKTADLTSTQPTTTATSGASQPITTPVAATLPAPTIPAPAPVSTSPAPIGLIGLTSIDLRGNLSIDAYDASTGIYDSAAKETATLYSNGKITVAGDLKLRGDLHAGPGIAFPPSKHSKITGVTTPLDKPIAAPAVDVAKLSAQATQTPDLPSGVLSNKNLAITGKRSVALPAGVYDLNDVTIDTKCTLHCDGPVTLLIRGRLTILGALETHQNRPKNLNLQLAGKGPAVLATKSEIYANLYAPQAAILFSGSGDFYGSILAQTLSISARRSFHIDTSLAKP